MQTTDKLRNNISIIKTILTILLLTTACSSGGGGSDNSEENESSESTEQTTTTSSSSNSVLKNCGANGRAIKIMPLGDSITESKSGYASYRYWLWHLLQDNACNVDFVGSRRGVSNGSKGGGTGSPKFSNFDQDNEGHWGWRTDEILSNMPNWAARYVPDLVLIHLGTNDAFQSNSAASTISEISQIIDILRANNPNVAIIIAQVIPSSRSNDKLSFLNSMIPGLAAQKNTSSSPVIQVNQSSGFSVSSDTFDGVHPDESGEIKMAQQWFNAIFSLVAANS